mgnify:CR=1 FL=1|jgi:hypothetical protein
MRKLSLLPCVTLLIAAAPANSAPPNVASQANSTDAQQSVSLSGGKAATAANEDKKICKQLPSSSSRLPNRACLTAKEWKQVEQDLEH